MNFLDTLKIMFDKQVSSIDQHIKEIELKVPRGRFARFFFNLNRGKIFRNKVAERLKAIQNSINSLPCSITIDITGNSDDSELLKTTIINCYKSYSRQISELNVFIQENPLGSWWFGTTNRLIKTCQETITNNYITGLQNIVSGIFQVIAVDAGERQQSEALKNYQTALDYIIRLITPKHTLYPKNLTKVNTKSLTSLKEVAEETRDTISVHIPSENWEKHTLHLINKTVKPLVERNKMQVTRIENLEKQVDEQNVIIETQATHINRLQTSVESLQTLVNQQENIIESQVRCINKLESIVETLENKVEEGLNKFISYDSALSKVNSQMKNLFSSSASLSTYGIFNKNNVSAKAGEMIDYNDNAIDKSYSSLKIVNQ